MAIEEELSRLAVLVVAAHPDDETIGAGGLLGRMRNPYILHVTDGCPDNLNFARSAGFNTLEAYAAARERELSCALKRAGISAWNTFALGMTDQEASLNLTGLIHRLIEVIRAVNPDAILTHPYEGGHPDHDSTAFSVHMACRLISAPPQLFEFTSYHAASPSDPALEAGCFLKTQDPGEVFRLSPEERERKAAMFACFASQAEMLQYFGVEEERFRVAPAYDFTKPPHSGRLFYEYFEFGMPSERWLSLAQEAMRKLEVAAQL